MIIPHEREENPGHHFSFHSLPVLIALLSFIEGKLEEEGNRKGGQFKSEPLAAAETSTEVAVVAADTATGEEDIWNSECSVLLT